MVPCNVARRNNTTWTLSKASRAGMIKRELMRNRSIDSSPLKTKDTLKVGMGPIGAKSQLTVLTPRLDKVNNKAQAPKPYKVWHRRHAMGY
jgi:hypothetical protein